MGIAFSMKQCVNLSELPPHAFRDLTSEDYTVIRTGDWEQTGWRIPTNAHPCPSTGFSSDYDWATGHASNRMMSNGKSSILGDPASPWRIYMVFDGEDSSEPAKKHACGWRVSDPERRTFWPTRLSGDSAEAKAAREVWWISLDAMLDSLESYEQKELRATSEITSEVKAAGQ
jgi:hypothetical protein